MGVGLDPVSGSRDVEQTIRRPWTFLAGIIVGAFKLATGAATGKLLKSDGDGVASWGLVPYASDSEIDFTANFTNTLIGASSAAIGTYLVTAYAMVTAAGFAGKTLAVTLAYTDEVGAVTPTLIAAFAADATGYAQGSLVVRIGSAAAGLDYTGTYAGGGAVATSSLYIDAIRLT